MVVNGKAGGRTLRRTGEKPLSDGHKAGANGRKGVAGMGCGAGRPEELLARYEGRLMVTISCLLILVWAGLAWWLVDRFWPQPTFNPEQGHQPVIVYESVQKGQPVSKVLAWVDAEGRLQYSLEVPTVGGVPVPLLAIVLVGIPLLVSGYDLYRYLTSCYRARLGLYRVFQEQPR